MEGVSRLNPEHITIILVRPQSPGNIGSTARAMQNMGLHRLALVAPERFPHFEARMMACGAEALLHTAQVYDSLQAAIAPCHWLVGTSARRRHYRHVPLTPSELARKMPGLCRDYQVGILFGPEDAGLTTDELNLCHDWVVIPTASEATSLNLSQAVMVICYEIIQRHVGTASSEPGPLEAQVLASVGETEAMYEHLRQAFTIHGFPDASAVDRMLLGVRRIFERTQLERRDVRLVRGIARQLAWALRHPLRSKGESGGTAPQD
jgi:tRNA/rRNA methyltransferase/tRNA (cytidine32/uridine32-2'-O)-methyltransferase